MALTQDNWVWNDGNNLTFGLANGSVITGSAPSAGGGGGIVLYDGANSITSGTARFTNANNVSFSINGQTVSGSVATSLTNINVSGGTTSNNLSAIIFSNLNGISFGLDGSTMTGSVATSLTNIKVSAGTTSNNLSAITFSDGNGITFGLNASTLTGSVAAQSNQTMSLVASSNTTANSSAMTFDARSLTLVFDGAASGGWSSNDSKFHISAPTQTAQTQSNIAGVYDGANSISTGTIRFTNANGVSFSINGQTLSGSVAAQSNQTMSLVASSNTTANSSAMTFDARSLTLVFDGAASGGWSSNDSKFHISAPTQTNQTLSVVFSSQTAGNSSAGTFDARSFTIVGSGIASVGWISDSSKMVINVPAGGGGGDGVNIIAAGTRTATTSGTVLFSDSNGISWGLNAVNGSVVTAQMATSSIVFQNSNGVTFGTSTNGSTTSVTASVTSHATASYYEPNMRGGASISSSMSNGTMYIQPFLIQCPITMNRLQWLEQGTTQARSTQSFSGSVSSQTATSGTGYAGTSGTWLLFSRQSTGTDANSSRIISFYSNSYSQRQGYSCSVTWSTNVSSVTVSISTSGQQGFITSIGSDGGVTTTVSTSSGSTSFSFTSTNQNSSSSSFQLSLASAMQSGIRIGLCPFATSLSEGEYWLGHIRSTDSNSTNYSLQTNCRVDRGIVGFTTNTTQYAQFGHTNTTDGTGPWQGYGSYSSSGNTSTTIALTAISYMSNIQTWFNMLYAVK